MSENTPVISLRITSATTNSLDHENDQDQSKSKHINTQQTYKPTNNNSSINAQQIKQQLSHYHNSVCHSQASTATSSSIGTSGIGTLRSPTTTKSQGGTTTKSNSTISHYENSQIICPPSPKRASFVDENGKMSSSEVATTSGLPKAPKSILQKSQPLVLPPHITQTGVSIDWTRNIENLLQSADGFRLLKHFLLLQNPQNLPTNQNLAPHVSSFSVKNLTLLDRMDFYFACKGFKQQFPENSEITNISLARHIYKKYVQKDSNLRSSLKQKQVSPAIFEIYQENTVQFLQNYVLPLFLESDTFANYCSELDRKQEREQVHAILPIINEQDDEKLKIPKKENSKIEDSTQNESHNFSTSFNKTLQTSFQLPKDHIYFFDENQHQNRPSNLESSVVSSRNEQGNVTSVQTSVFAQKHNPPPPSMNCTESKFSESWMSERDSSVHGSISGSSARMSFRKLPRPGTIRIPKSKLTRARDTICQFAETQNRENMETLSRETQERETAKKRTNSVGPETTISSSSQEPQSKASNNNNTLNNINKTLQTVNNTSQVAEKNNVKPVQAATSNRNQQLDCRDTKVKRYVQPTREQMHMATNNPSKFAAILIEKLNIVVKVEEIENQPPSSSNILETSFTDTGKIITSSSSQNTFKRPTVPMSNKEARVQRVSEWVDTSQYITATNQLDDLKSKLIIEAESEDTSFTEETVIIYEITSDRHPYKIKVPTNRMTMTLQQFKSCLGSSVRTKIAQTGLGARFFFKTYDKDVDGALFVELVNDSDIVPLFESRIHAKIDPM